MTDALIRELMDEVKALRAELRRTQRAVLNRDEAAEYLTVSVRTLHTLVQKGDIKRVALSEGRHAFRREELDRYLADHEAAHVDIAERDGKRLYADAMSR